MEDKTEYNIIHSDDEYVAPQECEQSEQAIKSISKTAVNEHYAFVGSFALAAIMIFAALFFMIVKSEQTSEDNENGLTFKSFANGSYALGVEKSYLKNLPYSEQIKSVQQHIAVLYGFGNKLSDKNKKSYESGDTSENASDKQDESQDSADEKQVTLTGVTTVTAAQTTGEKKTVLDKSSSTTALTRPKEKSKTSSQEKTTTTTTAATTTNNTSPATFKGQTAPTVTTTAPKKSVTTTQTQITENF